MQPVSHITEISKQIFTIQANPLKEDLSSTIDKVQEQLDDILADPSRSDFGLAVGFQFSFLKTIKDRIGTEAYQKTALAKIKEIGAKKLADEEEQEDLRLYLEDFAKKVIQSS